MESGGGPNHGSNARASANVLPRYPLRAVRYPELPSEGVMESRYTAKVLAQDFEFTWTHSCRCQRELLEG